MTNREQASPDDDVLSRIGIDADNPNSARRYNYWLGGKDNFKADRASAKAIEDVFPHAPINARENRSFLQRAVRYLVEEYGIRQFLDIGAGLPTTENTHQIAQAINATCRTVYVDNDDMVMIHANAWFNSPEPNTTAFIKADLRHPEKILRHRALRILNISEPIAVILGAVLHYIHDDHGYAAVRTLMDAAAPGSFLALSHATTDGLRDEARAAFTSRQILGTDDVKARTEKQVSRFFDESGLILVEPGLTMVSDWRPDLDAAPVPVDHVAVYGGVAIKPLPGTTARARAGLEPITAFHAAAGAP